MTSSKGKSGTTGENQGGEMIDARAGALGNMPAGEMPRGEMTAGQSGTIGGLAAGDTTGTGTTAEQLVIELTGNWQLTLRPGSDKRREGS